MDRLLVARGTTFTDVSTTFPMTHIAHLSAFTGLYPAAFDRHRGALPTLASIPTLAGALSAAGFETGAITEDGLVSGQRGFWYGFDEFTERTGFRRGEGHTGLARETFADGIRYLDAHRDRKFFLFLHTYQTHSPYTPAPAYQGLFRADASGDPSPDPSPYVPVEQRAARDNYDREIRETDDIVAGFLEALERLGLDQRTYVVVFSDHGEAFGEHGRLHVGHGWAGHDEQLRVPLIVRGPGVPAGRRIAVPTSLVDLTPTLLDLLGVPQLPRVQGTSMYGVLQGGEAPAARPIYFEWTGVGIPRGVRYGDMKLVRHLKSDKPPVLFDLAQDPAERRPILGPHAFLSRGPQLLDAYEAEGARLARALGTANVEPEREPIGKPVVDALRALGYLQ
jgi:arylsulfatase A-like enzyme